MAALTLGTGAFLWLNAGTSRPQPPPGVLATAAWETLAGGPTYALEAFGANAGNALAILRELGLLPAQGAVPAPAWSNPHPIVVAAPSGLGTPHWHPADRITTNIAMSLCIAGSPYLLFKAEVQLLFWAIHVLFEKLFPDFCPGPIEHIRDAVLNDLSRRNLRGESIDRVQRPRAFGPCEPRGVTP